MKIPQVIRESPTPLLLLLLLTGVCIDAYKPVVIVHGLFQGPEPFKTLVQRITKAHPGTKVKVISLYNNGDSLEPLWRQVRDFRKAIKPIMRKARNGIHLLCYSQGGLICRALLATTPYHNVRSFISLASPQAGQYGVTGYVKRIFPFIIRSIVFHACYNSAGQALSICNYWNDPHHRHRYFKNNIFLPQLDGDRHHNKMKSWRKNFLRIKRLVLIGGPDDGVITPWQSSLFGFYDGREHVVKMMDEEFYKEDTFGLKTLNARGDVSMCVLPGVEHSDWYSSPKVFRRCILKWLT